MRKYLLVSSLKRGSIIPPEPVDAETQKRIEASVGDESCVQRRPQWQIDSEYNRMGA